MTLIYLIFLCVVWLNTLSFCIESQQPYGNVYSESLSENNSADTEHREMAIQMKQQNKDNLFGLYASNQFVEQMLNGEEELVGTVIYGSIFFANIKDAAACTNQSEQSEMMDELNDFYTRIQVAVQEDGGIIHQCGDDAIVALFGAPTPMEEHAQIATSVAFKMMNALMMINKKRIQQQGQPLRIGFGVNTGDLLVGNLNNTQWHSNMVSGQTVNIATHLSHLNKTTPIHTVFLGESTAQSISPPQDWQIERLNDVLLPDKTAVPLFALLHAM
jgi:adenylate cyclase